MVRRISELIFILDEQLSSESKDGIRALAEEDLWRLHLDLNAMIRSIAFYRNDSVEGKEYFGRLGLMPDDSSAVLGAIYWRHVRQLSLSPADMLTLLHSHFVLAAPSELELIAEELSSDYASNAA
jgi:hypothetical protein